MSTSEWWKTPSLIKVDKSLDTKAPTWHRELKLLRTAETGILGCEAVFWGIVCRCRLTLPLHRLLNMGHRGDNPSMFFTFSCCCDAMSCCNEVTYSLSSENPVVFWDNPEYYCQWKWECLHQQRHQPGFQEQPQARSRCKPLPLSSVSSSNAAEPAGTLSTDNYVSKWVSVKP